MRNIIRKTAAILLGILCTSTIFSQNVTIDYKDFSSTACDVFNTATNVTSTINSTSGNISHITVLGDAKYTAANKAIQLDNNQVTTSEKRGTTYRITYSFKTAYRYIITVTSASASTSNQPALRLDLTNSTSSGGTTCNGTETVVVDLTGNPAANTYSSTTFTDVQFAFSTPLANPFSGLELRSMPAATDGASNSIYTLLSEKIIEKKAL